jgi:hypothetical protein
MAAQVAGCSAGVLGLMDKELAAMIDKANAIQAGLRATREANRSRFPFMTRCVDALNAAGMGPVRVIFADEGGNRAGKEPA